jgi:hypothetical protein
MAKIWVGVIETSDDWWVRQTPGGRRYSRRATESQPSVSDDGPKRSSRTPSAVRRALND